MLTIIMAGGKGTRIAEIAGDIPKPLIPICGKPVLEREIECLRKQGFTDIIITVSYMHEKIMEYFEDGSKFGVSIRYYVEKEPLGNAGALFRLTEEIKESGDDDFLLLNADSIFDIDFLRFVSAHKRRDVDVTLFTHPNSHPYDSGLLITDKEGNVKQWLTKEDDRPKWYKNRVNAGLHVINYSVLEQYMDSLSEDEKTLVSDGGTDGTKSLVVPRGKIDLDRKLLKPLANTGRMQVYDSPEYVKDMGTPDRYKSVTKDYEAGIVSDKNLCHKQKAIFLDRDGTINKYAGFLRNIDDFELLPDVSEAIAGINSAGYLAIVITNQPVVARGEVTIDALEEIHMKMETLLGEKGAYLDGIYYCPHHPDKGFEGEIKELKIICDCRKPKPGMLIKAANDFNIDLEKSWMVGDGQHDMLAGRNAGTKIGLIKRDGEHVDVCPDIKGNNLKEIVEMILREE